MTFSQIVDMAREAVALRDEAEQGSARANRVRDQFPAQAYGLDLKSIVAMGEAQRILDSIGASEAPF